MQPIDIQEVFREMREEGPNAVTAGDQPSSMGTPSLSVAGEAMELDDPGRSVCRLWLIEGDSYLRCEQFPRRSRQKLLW